MQARDADDAHRDDREADHLGERQRSEEPVVLGPQELDEKTLGADQLAGARAEIAAEIEAAFAFALESRFPDESELMAHIFAGDHPGQRGGDA